MTLLRYLPSSCICPTSTYSTNIPQHFHFYCPRPWLLGPCRAGVPHACNTVGTRLLHESHLLPAQSAFFHFTGSWCLQLPACPILCSLFFPSSFPMCLPFCITQFPSLLLLTVCCSLSTTITLLFPHADSHTLPSQHCY